VVLAVLDVFSLITSSVALRVHEMAIRIALGSQQSGIIRLIMVSGAKLALIGCALVRWPPVRARSIHWCSRWWRCS